MLLANRSARPRAICLRTRQIRRHRETPGGRILVHVRPISSASPRADVARVLLFFPSHGSARACRPGSVGATLFCRGNADRSSIDLRHPFFLSLSLVSVSLFFLLAAGYKLECSPLLPPRRNTTHRIALFTLRSAIYANRI